ncbi:hypothetical protein G3O06_37890 [Burkholderia sp. Ac-20345]|uniref:hypothetical protein n=1 Tax=Burkholderia sp. Ac-20345 TaxID=2703891 RepID=UPI00197B62CD|nr:hypothetical protein [Burkholderia sp. Ac-20345]MBN3783252.1 hypothetical protein [Burkholderia sp. Ac-20345]
MAVKIYMPDGTVKEFGKKLPTSRPAETAVGPVERRKSSPSSGARRLKEALDRLDQVDLHVNQRKEVTKKPAHSR